MTVAIGVVCEARADFDTGTGLTDRVLGAAADWIADNDLDDLRRYQGEIPNEPYLLWREVSDRYKRASLPLLFGRFRERKRDFDARPAVQALFLFRKACPAPEAVILLRDDDRLGERGESLRLACMEIAEKGMQTPIVIGLALTKRECWVLAGFVANTPQERERLDHLRRELGFDPCRESTRLNDKGDGEPRSVKRVLRELTQDDREREACCWLDTPFEVLRDQGRDTGLAEFLAELQDKLVPLFV